MDKEVSEIVKKAPVAPTFTRRAMIYAITSFGYLQAIRFTTSRKDFHAQNWVLAAIAYDIASMMICNIRLSHVSDLSTLTVSEFGLITLRSWTSPLPFWLRGWIYHYFDLQCDELD